MIILYITYDGLLDPLGSSQILPYVKSISKHQDEVVVVSFEKYERLLQGKDTLLSELQSYSIKWKPLRFTKGLGLMGKFWDLSRMYLMSIMIAFKYNIEVVHARGHPPAQVGLFIKRISNAKFIFDFRGLWVDERVDKEGWNLDYLFHRIQFRYFKRVERKLLMHSDHVVVLTHKVVDEVMKLGTIKKSRITVIPCCADYNLFNLAINTHKIDSRISLDIPLLGQIPLVQSIRESGDAGRPAVLQEETPSKEAFLDMCTNIIDRINWRNNNIDPSKIVPVEYGEPKCSSK